MCLTEVAACFAPSAKRVTKLRKWVRKIFADKKISPTVAGELAGKCGFLATTVCGRLGRAALKPLFARQHASGATSVLTPTLRAALTMLVELFAAAPPRTVPYAVRGQYPALVFSDAYFQLGDSPLRPGHPDQWPELWSVRWPLQYLNGWGAVVFFSDRSIRPVVLYGRVPPLITKDFAGKGECIYILEALGQLLPIIALGPWLEGPVISFIDNVAAQFALVKGYSRHVGGNVVSSCYWGAAARYKINPWFERVASASNIADAISRFDLSEAARQGWYVAQLDFSVVFEALLAHLRNPAKSPLKMAARLHDAFTAQRNTLPLARW